MGLVRGKGTAPRRRYVAIAVARTLALYGFASWFYIALVALVHPETLPLQLTHLATWPREDTFGEASFVVSLLAYFVHAVLTTGRAHIHTCNDI